MQIKQQTVHLSNKYFKWLCVAYIKSQIITPFKKNARAAGACLVLTVTNIVNSYGLQTNIYIGKLYRKALLFTAIILCPVKFHLLLGPDYFPIHCIVTWFVLSQW